MSTIIRTDSGNRFFQELVKELDQELAYRNGDKNAFFAQYNKTNLIQHVVVLFLNDKPVACGAIKEYDTSSMEVKRMFVVPGMRGRGLAAQVLCELEKWAFDLGYKRCVLETGDKMPEAIALYKRSKYTVIPNYGQYAGVESSICFEKEIRK